MSGRLAVLTLTLCAALCLAACVPATRPAPTTPTPATGPIAHLPGVSGDYFVLNSTAVGRRYHVFVSLPETYASEPERRFPVSFLLDGDSLYPMLAPTHLMLTYDDNLPPAIVVGIAYGGFDPSINMRHIDFRPTLDDGSPGGSAAFLEMLEDELLPLIDAHYRTDPASRTLFGQSRSGSFVLYAANNRPALFRGFIASNPARERDGHLYGLDAPSAAPGVATLVLTSGTRDMPALRESASEWATQVAPRNDLPWRAIYVPIEGGTHAASAARAYRAGMLRVFGLPTND